MKKILCAIGVALTVLSLTGDAGAAELKKIRIGVSAQLEPEVLAGKPALEKKGYEVEVVVFAAGPTIYEAVAGGDVDCAINPHQPAIDSYNASKGTNIVMLKPYIHKVVFGMFSDKYRAANEIPEGSAIVIPQDATNMSRALFLLQEIGLIKLMDGVTVPTDLDILDNPKKLQLQVVEVPKVMKSLPDVAACLCAKLYVIAAGVSPDTEICLSSDMERFQTGFIVHGDRASEPWTKDLVAAYTTEKQRDAINSLFKGAFVPAF